MGARTWAITSVLETRETLTEMLEFLCLALAQDPRRVGLADDLASMPLASLECTHACVMPATVTELTPGKSASVRWICAAPANAIQVARPVASAGHGDGRFGTVRLPFTALTASSQQPSAVRYPAS
jgi:hypothetical protein